MGKILRSSATAKAIKTKVISKNSSANCSKNQGLKYCVLNDIWDRSVKINGRI